MTVSPVYTLYWTSVKTKFRVWCLYRYLVHGMSGCFRGRRRGGGGGGMLEGSYCQGAGILYDALIKKNKKKFSSYIRKFRVEQLQSHIYKEGLPIWGNAQIVPHIWGGRKSYMTLQLLHSEFPYIWGKYDFLFYQCGVPAPAHDFAHVGVMCTFSNISAAAAAGIAWTSQLSSSLAGQPVRPAHHSTNQPPPPSPLLQPGRAPWWVNSLLPSASVVPGNCLPT